MMTDEKKISGYIVKNQRPDYRTKQEKEIAEQVVVRNVLREYNKLGMQEGGKIIS